MSETIVYRNFMYPNKFTQKYPVKLIFYFFLLFHVPLLARTFTNQKQSSGGLVPTAILQVINRILYDSQLL